MALSKSSIPLVLLPGFMLDESLWDDMVARFGQHAPIYRFRLAPGATIQAVAEHIAKAAPERFVLVGFSLGDTLPERWLSCTQAESPHWS